MKGIFIDIETTGLDFSTHVPIEIALIIADMVTCVPIVHYTNYIKCSDSDWSKATSEALKVNGITLEDLASAPFKEDVMNQIEQLFKKHNAYSGQAVFVCHNSSFDRGFFSQILSEDHIKSHSFPYHWLDLPSMYWMKYFYNSGFKEDISFAKDSIAKSLGLQEEVKPHRAYNGAKHLLECYSAMKKSQVYVNPISRKKTTTGEINDEPK